MVDRTMLDPSVLDVRVKSKIVACANLLDVTALDILLVSGSVLDVTAVNNPLLEALHVTDLDVLALTMLVIWGAGRRTGTHCVERTIS